MIFSTKNLRYGIFCLFICTTISVQAGNEAAYKSALKLAHDNQLHELADWQHLIQYTSDWTGKVSSEIQSDGSFFAPDGRSNPQHELDETIRAMFEPVSSFTDADSHPRCKFIARYHFLSQHIQFPSELQNLRCNRFNEWIDIESIDSISLVFASGYFKNPASFYGHPLLKFNSKRSGKSNLLDITINNGAIVPANENPVVYMVKGIFGGYESAFSDTKFYQLNHSYSESDLRDLWDYELNLTTDQQRKAIYYSWELLNHRFTYRFFSQNCGYFLEDLLQYALGRRVSPRPAVYTLPSTTFFNLVDTEINGVPLVSKVSRIPSRHNRFHEKHTALTQKEKALMKRLVKMPKFNLNVGGAESVRVIDTLIDYYTFLIAKTKSDTVKRSYSVKRTQLYAKRLSVTKKDIFWPENVSSTPPHLGSRPSLVQLSLIHNSELGDGVGIRLRPASYDLIDLDDGHVPNSTLNMFNIEAVSFGSKQRLTRFDLVNIQTLNLSRTGLPGDGGLGWGLRFGLERVDNSCLNCLVGQVSGSAAKAYELNSAVIAYGEFEATFHSNYQGRSTRVAASLGVVGNVSQFWKSHLLAGKRGYIDGDNRSGTVLKWSNRFGKDPRSTIRFDINYDGSSEVQLSYGRYW